MKEKERQEGDIHDEALLFPALLASLTHDMKNSLGMLITTTEEIFGNCPAETCPSYPLLSKLQYESKRLNNNLMQLLALYKMDHAQLTLNIEFQAVQEFIEDTVLQNRPLLEFKGISIETDCPEELVWCFDRDLVSGVINNVLNNAYRYARDKIWLSAREEAGCLVLYVRDDGQGYPTHMLTENAGTKRVNFSTGSTGLGLYFASLIAKMHKNKGREGYIRTTNGDAGSGGCFSIYLP